MKIVGFSLRADTDCNFRSEFTFAVSRQKFGQNSFKLGTFKFSPKNNGINTASFKFSDVLSPALRRLTSSEARRSHAEAWNQYFCQTPENLKCELISSITDSKLPRSLWHIWRFHPAPKWPGATRDPRAHATSTRCRASTDTARSCA